ncbi:phosphotransferase [Paenibacillus donghaensis]|uniref:PEP/pyruvate-binding domain-containing protein n=1 Tax=Paenibacillus donghaensis TaxID=414771 RepID=UPI0018845F85|nr:PEP/pyruvate-binding domain-containing protein [Paenibacillus donghaensis]MBE9916900.1 phosphotransferase [Paenibacillus donghaensis]
MYTQSFLESEENMEILGAKGYHLVKMHHLKLPVPDGFVISTHAITDFLKENQIDINGETNTDVLSQAPFPKQLEEEILHSFRELLQVYPSVAVRSSSTVEDLDQASFAGQYETFLHIHSETELLQKVKECWCSAFTDQVQNYQRKIGKNDGEGRMAVVVQGLIDADVSGVAFSENPVTFEKDKLVLSASYGLGESIVSGSVTPDTYIIDRENKIISRQLGTKETMLRPDKEGVVEIYTTKEQQENYCLSGEQAIAVAQLARKVEEHYGYAVDIEFAFSNSRLFLLQARPITTNTEFKFISDKQDVKMRPDLLLSEEEKADFWINIDAIIAGPVTPLFASFMVPAIRDSMERLAAESFTSLSFRDIKVYNGNLFAKVKGNVDLSEMQIPEQQYPELVERMRGILERDFFPFYEKMSCLGEQHLSHHEAIQGVQDLKDFYIHAMYQQFNITMPAEILQERFKQLFVELYGEDDSLLFHQLLTGKMSKTLEVDQGLWELANQVKKSPALCAVFTNKNRNTLINGLRSSAEGRELLKDLDTFLKTYGWRSMRSHEFSEETWVENPIYAVGIIQNLLRNEVDFNQEFKKKETNRQEAYNKVMEMMDTRDVSPEKKKEFNEVYQWAFDASSIKDDHHFYIDLMLDAKARVFLLNVADLLVSEGQLETKEMIWFVYDHELLEALQEKISLIEISKRRKQEHVDHEHYRAPAYFGNPTEEEKQMVKMMAGDEDTRNTENQIYGVGASGGIYSGPAKVIHHADEFDKLEPGDVLICKMTTPVWTSLFQTAAAVVTDTGGILSHSAIVAREYRIPAVVGTQIATQSITDGEWLVVNGTKGLVEKL